MALLSGSHRPYRVGLTGGIGSGKSTVGGLFQAQGVPVLDADEIARELVSPRQPALAQIAEMFGADLVDREGRLDRAKLRELIFKDPGARRQLEALLHPRIYEALALRAEALTAPYCIFAIPLLLETGQKHFVDRVLVVDCSVEQQIARTRQRDDSSEDTVRRIIASQVERHERLQLADDRIDNSGSGAALPKQVERLHRQYLALSQPGIAGQTGDLHRY